MMEIIINTKWSPAFCTIIEILESFKCKPGYEFSPTHCLLRRIHKFYQYT